MGLVCYLHLLDLYEVKGTKNSHKMPPGPQVTWIRRVIYVMGEISKAMGPNSSWVTPRIR